MLQKGVQCPAMLPDSNLARHYKQSAGWKEFSDLVCCYKWSWQLQCVKGGDPPLRSRGVMWEICCNSSGTTVSSMLPSLYIFIWAAVSIDSCQSERMSRLTIVLNLLWTFQSCACLYCPGCPRDHQELHGGKKRGRKQGRRRRTAAASHHWNIHFWTIWSQIIGRY